MLLSTFYWSNGSQEYNNKLHFKMQSLANLPNVMYIIYLKWASLDCLGVLNIQTYWER